MLGVLQESATWKGTKSNLDTWLEMKTRASVLCLALDVSRLIRMPKTNIMDSMTKLLMDVILGSTEATRYMWIAMNTRKMHKTKPRGEYNNKRYICQSESNLLLSKKEVSSGPEAGPAGVDPEVADVEEAMIGTLPQEMETQDTADRFVKHNFSTETEIYSR